jgi:hypothetical protein
MISGFSGCDKESNVKYEVQLEAQLEIPPGLNNVETHYFILRNIPTFYKQSAEARGINPESITSVRSSRGLLIGDFQSINMDFIQRISIYAVSRKDPNEKREIYYLDEVPFGVNDELRMLSSTTELIQILSEEFVDLEIRLNFRSFIGTTIRTKLIFGYTVF